VGAALAALERLRARVPEVATTLALPDVDYALAPPVSVVWARSPVSAVWKEEAQGWIVEAGRGACGFIPRPQTKRNLKLLAFRAAYSA
jgi:hypothetical protein